MIESWRNSVLSLNLEARRRYAKIFVAKNGRYPRHGEMKYAFPTRPKQTKAEILDFARRHKAWTSAKFIQAGREHPEEFPPLFRHVIFYWGHWQTFKKDLKNFPEYWNTSDEIPDETLLKLVAKLCIRSRAQYREAYRTNDLLPCEKEIRTRYGGFRVFFKLVESFDVDFRLEKYFVASIAAGHPLTDAESRKVGVDIEELRDIVTPKLLAKMFREKERLFRKSNPEFFAGILNDGTLARNLKIGKEK